MIIIALLQIKNMPQYGTPYRSIKGHDNLKNFQEIFVQDFNHLQLLLTGQ